MKLTYEDGRAAVYDDVLPPELLAPLSGFDRHGASFLCRERPWGNPLDGLAEAVLDLAGPHRGGLLGGGWFDLVLSTAWNVHGPGPEIMVNWHTHATGSAVFYAHAEWPERWGGQLLLPARDWRVPRALGPGEIGDDRVVVPEGEPVLAIPPRPNRLVLMAGGVPHAVRRVEFSGAVRKAVIGFFVPRESPLARGRP